MSVLVRILNCFFWVVVDRDGCGGRRERTYAGERARWHVAVYGVVVDYIVVCWSGLCGCCWDAHRCYLASCDLGWYLGLILEMF